MVGLAAQEMLKDLEQTRRPYWEGVAKRESKCDTIFKLVNSKFGILQPDIVNRIKTIQSLEVLDALFDFSLRAESMDQFTEQVRKNTDN